MCVLQCYDSVAFDSLFTAWETTVYTQLKITLCDLLLILLLCMT